MKKQGKYSGRYIWCFVGDDKLIRPEGYAKSLSYVLSIKHHQQENWKLYKLIKVKEK